jgi:hypothetical protein
MIALAWDGRRWTTLLAGLLVDGIFGCATVLLTQGDLVSIGSIAPAIYLVAGSTCSGEASLNLLHPALVHTNSWHRSCNNVTLWSWLCYSIAGACNWQKNIASRCVVFTL